MAFLILHDGCLGLVYIWGRTIKHVVDSITETDLSNVDVIQLVGSLGSGDPAIDGPELVSNSRLGIIHGVASIIGGRSSMAHGEICAR